MKTSKKLNRKSRTKNNSKLRTKKGGYAELSVYSSTVENSPSFQGLPIRYYYDLNDYNADPNNSKMITDSRLTGGKSRRNKKYSRKSRKYRKQRGGFNIFSNTPFLGTSSFNIPASFGSLPSAFITKDIISGDTTSQYPQNPSTIQQPAEAKYNYNNMPLV
jgi:hypothetical protein